MADFHPSAPRRLPAPARATVLDTYSVFTQAGARKILSPRLVRGSGVTPAREYDRRQVARCEDYFGRLRKPIVDSMMRAWKASCWVSWLWLWRSSRLARQNRQPRTFRWNSTYLCQSGSSVPSIYAPMVLRLGQLKR